MQNYVCYHLHTELSLLDSCTNFKLYVDKAKELEQSAICFTEHGNCYNWIEKKMYCEQQGIKYIHGIECYLTKELFQADDEQHKIRDNYHTILIARNYQGLQEINLLIDKSTQPDHFYYKPRLSFDEFKGISSNVIKISACLASPLNQLRCEDLITYYDYLEVQPHINSKEQKEYNQWLYKMSLKYNKPLIAGTDTHSLNKYKAECRSILQISKHIRFTNEDEFDLTFKSYDELVDMFEQQNVLPKEVYLTAIDNTNKMADSVETFQLDTSFKYAKCYDDDEAVLKKRVNQRYADKLKRGVIQPNPQYKINVREELRVFKKIGMLGFMLFMSDLISWCWDNGIPIGYCRGSVGGSTIAYLTDIIDVDPVVWNTVFSRFANEDRKELGDIDIDISPTQRHLVYEHIIQSFGQDYTAYILAIGTISDKGTIDDIGRALSEKWAEQTPEYQAELTRINNNSDNKTVGQQVLDQIKKSDKNPYSLNNVARIKKEYEENPDKAKTDYPELFYYFDGLLNTAISQSMHPAGIIVSPISLPDNYGTFWADDKRILQINMDECHEINLNKYDLLGLKNVEIIKDTCALAGIPYPKANEINWNDEAVWADMITSPAGIFQFESDFAFKMLQQFKPHSVNDMSKINASLRPSGASYRDRLLAKEFNHNPSQIIDDLLADTYGHLVYQEQVIAFLQQICGLSGSAADNIRRAIGRKQKDRLDAAMPSILEGYCLKSDKPRNVAEEEAKKFLQIIEDASSYMFGFNHSTGYSMIGYTCAFLRYYYPYEFIAAYLNNANNEEDIVNGTKLAQIKGIKIMPPKFRYSNDMYQPSKETNAIYKSTSSIKFLNASVAKQLYEIRDEHFESFIDLLNVFTGDSRQLDILIHLGYFSEFGGSLKLLKICALYDKYYGKKQIKKEQTDLPFDLLSKYASSETAKIFKFDANGINNMLKEIISNIPDQEIPIESRLRAEKENLGYISYRDDSRPNTAVVMDISTKYAPKLELYILSTGESIFCKITKKSFEQNPLCVGDCISYKISQKPKWKKDDKDHWVQDYSGFDNWLEWYSEVDL